MRARQTSSSNVIAVEFGPSANPESDIALIERIARGDKDAMRVLYSRHGIRVYQFALRITGDRVLSENLLSGVFLTVWRHAGKFEGLSRVSTWLLAIARNLTWSAMRRRSTEELNASSFEEIEDHSDSPETALQRRQQSAALAMCLTRLSPEHREVIDLVYYHGRSVSEISSIVRSPQGTVKTRMHYARKEISRLLEQFGSARRAPDGESHLRPGIVAVLGMRQCVPRA